MLLSKEKFLANVLNFSAQTSAKTVQDIIISKLDKYNTFIWYTIEYIPITYKLYYFIGEEEVYLVRLLVKNVCYL